MEEFILPHSHDSTLVVISIIIAVCASYIALQLAGRVTASHESNRLMWLIGGALVMGTGIWSMHFTAMLAYQLPIAIYFNIPLVFYSWFAAVVISGIALHTASQPQVSLTRLGLSGIMMGIGIGFMHYVGMAAIRLQGDINYSSLYVILSLVIAVTASWAALWLAIFFRDKESGHFRLGKMVSALVMGAAISGMHFTGMHAVRVTFIPDRIVDTSQSIDISALGTSAIIITTFIVLSFALIFSIVDRRFALQSAKLAQNDAELAELNQRLTDYVNGLEKAVAIGRATASVLDRNVLVQQVRMNLRLTFHYREVRIFVYEEAAGGWQNLDTESEPVASLITQSLAAEEPTVCQHDPHDPASYARISIPVEYGNEGHAVLYVEQQPGLPFTQQDQKLLELIAGQVGVAFNNAELFELTLRAKQMATSATLAKSLFLSNMTHELRTPMNGVLGMTSILLDTELSDEQLDIVNTIRASGDALLTIINDILDFSKIEANKLELEKIPFSLRGCIEETLDLVATRATAKQLNLAYFIEPDVPSWVTQDVTRVRQILTNLLSNAVKFTDAGEVVVTLSAVRESEASYKLRFDVRDTGIGIPNDRVHRLFHSFSQVDASTTRKFGGTGLGLAISKRLSIMMGGDMFVETAEGKGSIFSFTIQAAAATRALVPEIVADGGLVGKKIVVFEGNATNRRLLRHYLSSWELSAVMGNQSADVIHPDSPAGDGTDAVIYDLQFYDHGGISTLNEVRSLYPAVPIILLVGRGQSIPEAVASVYQASVSKPIRPSQLHDAITTAIHGKASAKPKERQRTRIPTTMGTDKPMRILLAEDNVVNQKVALSMLRRLGYSADVAANGQEAIEALERQNYDTVLMDVNMPEMDGVEATMIIRDAVQPTDQPYIIAMTANAMEGDKESFLAAGMDFYVSKPVSITSLIKALEMVPLTRPRVLERS